jgi:membrane protein
MLLWMWISAQVILLGAEINAILEHRSPEGKAPGSKTAEDGKVVTATKAELEEGGAQLPGSREFRPTLDAQTGQPVTATPKLGKTPLAAAVRWAAGLGLGLFLVRRNTAR